MKKIAFIGAGNMGGALIMGICKAIDPQQVIIFDTDTAKVQTLCEKTGCAAAATAEEACAAAQYVVLAVKPQVLRTVQTQLIPVMQENAKKGIQQIVVSIAAGI